LRRARQAGDHHAFSEAQIAPKRQVPRVPTTLTIRLPDGWRGEVLDLSANGLRVRTMAVLQAESTIDAAIEREGKLIPVKATVIWAEPPNFDLGQLGEMGLQLNDVSEDYLQLVTDLFAET
jgi:hypothetical protein